MRKEDNHIDELFRSKLDDVEVRPPAYVWDAILEKQAAAKRKKRALWMNLSGVAAALLLAFLLGWKLQQEGKLPANTEMAAEQAVKEASGSEAPKALGGEEMHDVRLAEGLLASEKTENGNENKSTGNGVTSLTSAGKRQKTFQAQNAKSADWAMAGNKGTGRSESVVEMLKKRLAKINLPEPGTDELDEMDRLGEGDFLSEQDRAIMAKNQQAMQAEEKRKDGFGWSVGAQVNPVLAVNDSQQSQEYASAMNASSDNSSMQMGGGLTVAVKRSGRWSLQSGVMYNSLSQSSSNDLSRRNSNLYYDVALESSGVPGAGTAYYKVGESSGGTVSIQTPAGKIQMSNLPQNAVIAADLESVASASTDVLMTSTDFEQRFEYLEIPLLVRYQLVDEKFGVQLMAGLNTGFLIGNSAYANSGSGRTNIGKTSDMNPVTYSSSFGLGLGYKLTPALQLRFEPRIRYYFESLSNNPDITYKPYTFGFYTGISYSF